MSTDDVMERAKKRSPLSRACWIGAVLLVLLVIAVFAYGIAFPIEGKLYCMGGSGPGIGLLRSLAFSISRPIPNTGTLAGLHRMFASRAVRFNTLPADDADPSLDGSECAWSVDPVGGGWPPTAHDLVVGTLDGTVKLSLSAAAGLKGINCSPRWSPDGKMIAFQHCDPDPKRQLLPCRIGFELWVMNADGSKAHRVTPKRTPDVYLARWSGPEANWSPDGSRIITYAGRLGADGFAFTTDVTGSDIQALPNVGMDPVYSPDGTLIASSVQTAGTVNGQPGVWRRLVVTNADGSDPTVLVEQFLPDSEINSRFPTPEDLSWHPKHDWRMDVRFWAGPRYPQWSPSGDMIAFLAALPFRFDGTNYKNQVDIWLLDLSDNRVINLTQDSVWQHELLWRK